jgi:hypothetical protein
MFFTMLKMKNRLHQWLHNIQKPLAGLFRHLVWLKIEVDRLPGSPPFKLVVSASTKHTLVGSTYPACILKRKHLAPGATTQTIQTVERLRVGLNYQALWAHGHHMTARNTQQG